MQKAILVPDKSQGGNPNIALVHLIVKAKSKETRKRPNRLVQT